MINIDEIKAGSESSFARAFEQFHGRLYYYFLKKTRSEEMADELVQLTFVKLWQFRHTLSADILFDRQLFTMATSSLIDYLRHQQSRRKKIIAMPENADELLPAAEEQGARRFEEADYLHLAMRSLSPVRKKVFLLSRVYGHSYKEIAHELSISVKTVEDHMVKALKHIRSIIVRSFLLFALVLFALLT